MPSRSLAASGMHLQRHPELARRGICGSAKRQQKPEDANQADIPCYTRNGASEYFSREHQSKMEVEC
jgi:hypothetical protein